GRAVGEPSFLSIRSVREAVAVSPRAAVGECRESRAAVRLEKAAQAMSVAVAVLEAAAAQGRAQGLGASSPVARRRSAVLRSRVAPLGSVGAVASRRRRSVAPAETEELGASRKKAAAISFATRTKLRRIVRRIVATAETVRAAASSPAVSSIASSRAVTELAHPRSPKTR